MKASLFLLLSLIACDPSGDDVADARPAWCTDIDASSCPDALPSFQADIVPMLDRACNTTCHAPGVGLWPLTGYFNVSAWWLTILSDTEQCSMPPPDAGKLSDSDRTTLITWLSCGHPNN